MPPPDACGAACRLCESVAQTLVGKKLGSFTRVSSAVRTAVDEAITRILTPKRSIDVLREAQAARSRYSFTVEATCNRHVLQVIPAKLVACSVVYN